MTLRTISGLDVLAVMNGHVAAHPTRGRTPCVEVVVWMCGRPHGVILPLDHLRPA